MILTELLQKRRDLNSSIVGCLRDDIIDIRVTAEHMVECATNIRGHGYSEFIHTREEFIEKIDKLINQLDHGALLNTK